VLEPVGLRDFGLALGYFVEGSFVMLPFIKVAMDAWNPGMHITKTGSTGRRVALILAGIAAVVGLSFVIPTHYRVTQQGVVIPEGFEALSSEVGGLIRTIHVRTGQWVKPGELVATLQNEQVASELRVAEADRQQAQVRFGAVGYLRGGDLSGGNAKMAQEMEVAEAGYQMAATRAQALELRAKSGGYVLTPQVEKLAGSYASPAQPVVRLGSMKRIQLAIPLSENDARVVRRGATVKGRWIANGEPFETQLTSVSSYPARPQEFHPGMLAYFGGAVPVQATASGSHEGEAPIFIANAVLDNPGGAMLEGMRGWLTIEGEATTWGKKAWRAFFSLFDLRASR
jgi:multidrug efflux pump subunit AcrA (membrane-fusion protein)